MTSPRTLVERRLLGSVLCAAESNQHGDVLATVEAVMPGQLAPWIASLPLRYVALAIDRIVAAGGIPDAMACLRDLAANAPPRPCSATMIHAHEDAEVACTELANEGTALAANHTSDARYLADAVQRADLVRHLQATIKAATGGADLTELREGLAQVSDSMPVGTPAIQATPFQWIDPAQLTPRHWLYGRRLVRGMLSLIGAAGGVGKSGMQIAEALAMVTRTPLLGEDIHGGPLRVWYWNLEDPQDEIQRRVLAACQHYGIGPQDIGDRLFIDSGRDSPLCIATTTRDGTILRAPVVEALVAELQARRIDVLMVDPYVSSHATPENDNQAQDIVAKAWGQVAHRANCAVYLAHHIRKSGGAEVTAESLRGGKALVDAARSVLVLNPMTKEEAEKAGLDTHRGYFRSDDDKCNLAPAPERASWFHVQGIQLANGDNVGVVAPWKWPDAFDGLTVADMEAVKQHLAGKAYRENAQSADWVGYEVAKVLHLDPTGRKADKAKLIRVIRTWVNNGALEVREIQDPRRREMKPCIVVAGDDCPTYAGGAGQGGAGSTSALPHHHPRKGCGGGAGQDSEAALPARGRGAKLAQQPSPDEDAFQAVEEAR